LFTLQDPIRGGFRKHGKGEKLQKSSTRGRPCAIAREEKEKPKSRPIKSYLKKKTRKKMVTPEGGSEKSRPKKKVHTKKKKTLVYGLRFSPTSVGHGLKGKRGVSLG